MNTHILEKGNEATEKTLSSLTSREADVLSQRFGIEAKATFKKPIKPKFKTKPPKGNDDEGGSGAPASLSHSFLEKS